ncbi:ribonuclease III [Pseudanabaena sp. FACHB-2040]|nr:ribonuclease III [Pseudanabaena sp. FACHB-2040]MBD2260710.1 ribonuclease III [Pseudanabaena sp. FACHB-2040]
MKQSKLPKFSNPKLLIKAMTHKSYANEHGELEADNERLEFLGDAILNFVCGELLYREFSQKPEGELTQLRASLVDKTQLAEFAIALDLNQHLRLGKGVEKSGGRSNPRLLSSAFEALVGAYFLDQGSTIDLVQDFVEPLFQRALAQRGATSNTANYKSRFQEWALAEFGEVPEYVIIEEAGPDHAKRFVSEVWVKGKPYGRGKGRKKQEAEKQAARSALETLGLLL